MGEIADMMLEGDLCEACGCYIDDQGGDGFPRYCSAQCARDRGATFTCEPVHQSVNQPMAKKLIKTLKSLSLFGTEDGPLTPSRGQSMYAGMSWKMASAQYSRLEKRGFVECRHPHNPAHDPKAVITQAGIDFLISIGELKPPKSERKRRKSNAK